MEDDYRSYVCPTSGQDGYYVRGAMIFVASINYQKIKPNHKIVDIGCGSLRVGKHYIPYLDSGNYCGIEPEQKWLKEGIEYELSNRMFEIKKPRFSDSSEFEISSFNETFDFAVAYNVFIHCGHRQLKQCLTNVKKCLSKKGAFIFSVLVGEENTERKDFCKYKYADSGITYYSVKGLDDLLKECGFKRDSQAYIKREPRRGFGDFIFGKEVSTEIANHTIVATPI